MSAPVYKPYDPSNLTPSQIQLGLQLPRMNKNSPVIIQGFDKFSMVVDYGFKRVTYAAQTRPTDGLYFWITEEHAKQIGLALRPTLDYLAIQVTMFEGRALEIMTENVPEGVQIDELIISHKSGDEVTHLEAIGTAKLATKLGVKFLHVWAAEYDDGALDKLVSTMEELGNKTLTKVDICDLTLQEPNDQIKHDGLMKLVERNKAS